MQKTKDFVHRINHSQFRVIQHLMLKTIIFLIKLRIGLINY